MNIEKMLEEVVGNKIFNVRQKFNYRQMGEIRLGLEHGVDVSVYADPKFNPEQMEEIRLGLENGIDARVYAFPENDWEQMKKHIQVKEIALLVYCINKLATVL